MIKKIKQKLKNLISKVFGIERCKCND